MGKNNNKKKDAKRKDQSVFKVAGSKVQKMKNKTNKTKPVTTNLKKMNLSQKEAQIQKADALLKDIGHNFRKPEKPKPKPYKNPHAFREPADVDGALAELEKLNCFQTNVFRESADVDGVLAKFAKL